MGKILTIALPLAVRPSERQPPGLHLIGHTIGCEKQQLGMGIGHKECGDHIFIFGRHALKPLAAALLRPEIGQGRAF